MQLVKGLADLHLFGMPWAETRPFENSAVFRGWVALELGRIDASVATLVGMQNGLVMGAIGVGGSDEQRAEWLPKFASGELLGCFGLTEPLSGSDSAQGLRTTATREGDEWVLNGAKRWIGNGTIASHAIIWAKSTEDGQVKGFIVPTSTPGFTATKIENKQALRIVQNADIVLDGRPRARGEPPAEGELVPRDRRRAAPHPRRGRLGRRRQLDRRLRGGGQVRQRARAVRQDDRLAPAHPGALREDARQHHRLDRACACASRQMLDEGTQRDEHAALAKEFTTSRMRETVAWARESMGGNGIVLDNDVIRHFADAEAMFSYEGTREMNTLIVGRAITGKAAFV